MRGGGSIINVASLNGLAALDLGHLGIRVNAILPGVIRTPMVAYVVEAREQQLAAGLPMGRIGEPNDIAAAAVFLASDESGWVTGIDLTVDGGHSAQTPRLA
jgi:NAD(P)-dependent dehydrogenase (short-subunit alcohol dehydrogenase family)